MKLTLEHIENHYFVTVTADAAFTNKDFVKVLEDIFSLEYWKPGMCVLFDNRKLDLRETSFENVKTAVEDFVKSNERFGDGKIAFLMKKGSDYGQGRQFQIMTEEKTSTNLQIFVNKEVAIRWLSA